MPEEKKRVLQHFYLPGHGKREDFKHPSTGGGRGTIPDRERKQHAQHLEEMLTTAIAAAQDRIANRDPGISGGTEGFYLEFELPRSQQHVLDALEDKRGKQHIELLSAHSSTQNPDLIQATVFVPESKSQHYLRKIRDYAEKDSVRYEKDLNGEVLLDEKGSKIEKSRSPKNQRLIAALESVRIAHTESLYTDNALLFPAAGREVWWEVWLRRGTRQVFDHATSRLGIVVKEHVVNFTEREVVLARSTPEAIGRIIANTDSIAELRLAQDTPAYFMELTGAEQKAWSQELVDRIAAPSKNAPAVCLLDSGTTRRHPLITLALAEEDQIAWRHDWGVEDNAHQWRGHGTQMSGVALYGDLTDALVRNDPIALRHRLESVKILPDHNENHPDLYGYITANAIARIEIQAPHRRRAYCLPVTSEGNHWRGRPSSWSAAIDDLAYGNGEDQRLILISAGNIRHFYHESEYLKQNDTAAIENPAQAWNALTVGAVTEKCTITNPDYNGWTAMAGAGDLSPSCRTSLSWDHEWPIKPDIVFEGGNHGVNPETKIGDHVDDLTLLTTFNRPEERHFTVTHDTSAATAQVARLAAQILSDRPHLWPETVRALIVHSAEWTPAMFRHLQQNPNRTNQRLIMRRYGYGVPTLDRATRSLSNDLTQVIESELQPFLLEGSKSSNCDMILHDLPWPVEALNALGPEQVEMRVTLSYFIEPNPGERGWTRRHRYGGHGLRFVVKRPEESIERFRRRVNAAAREEGERIASGGNDDGWVLGSQLRDRGSLHSDVWRGTAADLANRHAIGVFPVGGWWREKPKLERSDRKVRYALVVSLRTALEVDLYTEVANALSVNIDIQT